MSDERPASSTATALFNPRGKGTETSFPGLPSVLQESLPRRLSTAALTYAAVFAVMLIVNLVEVALDPAMSFEAPDIYATMGASIVLAVGVALWSRRSGASTRSTHTLGLAFQVIGTFGIALASIDLPLPNPNEDGYIGIPWTCPWILAYPLMVPSLPRYAAVTGVVSSLTCAAAVKFRLVVLEPTAADPVLQVWIGMVFVNLVCAAWGVVGSVIINKLGRQLSEARRMGSYQLERLLGQGGMGEVWEGRHRLLSRPAAIKLIRSEVLGGDSQGRLAMRRFEREAQATAALQSPHSVGLYDFGTADDGTFYYVMELLDGVDLQDFIERYGPVPPARAIHWLRHACHSLAEAHHNGLIHRDVKPANLHVCRCGLEWDFLKVLDFGLVKPAGPQDKTATGLTIDHTLAGTPAFMSPESASQEGAVDARADIYALGCVAYWLLTARLVFQAETPLNMILQHVQTDPVAPSSVAEFEISPELNSVVLACLEKDPADRPQSAVELSQRLTLCPESDAWTQEQARQWWAQHRPASA